MSTVYVAEDQRHGRRVALKVLRPDATAREFAQALSQDDVGLSPRGSTESARRHPSPLVIAAAILAVAGIVIAVLLR